MTIPSFLFDGVVVWLKSVEFFLASLLGVWCLGYPFVF